MIILVIMDLSVWMGGLPCVDRAVREALDEVLRSCPIRPRSSLRFLEGKVSLQNRRPTCVHLLYSLLFIR